ncbi:class I SAM-dependent RNA methyltransferase [Polymorphobacter sp.]|uniref:class I SAM-dependent RNA methyltransferase n=1 Tax=Polymorphobacter sp. TaxID=1909290 RepID=UPI003F705531
MSALQTIVRLAARGDGITADGRYVMGAAVGDQIRFDGEQATILPGPNHVVPVCRHVPECGGCQLQHVTDADYAAFVIDRLARVLGPLMPEDVAPVALSPPRSRRRASLRAVRRGGKLLLGFNSEGSHRIIDLQQCEVLRPKLFALIGPLRALLHKAVAEGQGAGITLTDSEAGVDVLLANVRAERLDEIERLTDFAAAHDLARLSVEGPDGVQTLVEARLPCLTMGGVRVGLPPAPFLQPTEEGEAALVAAVAEAVGGAGQVADLFCGLGTFALPLSRRARVQALDAAGPAIAALAAAARLGGRPLAAVHRDLFRRPLTPAELAPFDALVFDPPRAGAEAQSRALAQSSVPVVVAVSCNPSTFGRDARILAEGGYRLDRLWPVAQFRWSSHVEVVARFSRQGHSSP